MSPRFSADLKSLVLVASPSNNSFSYALPGIIDEDSSTVSVEVSQGFDSSFMSFEDLTLKILNIT